jgi:mannitol-1-phosphate 5-dehydrogenase
MAGHVLVGFGFGPIQSGLFAKEAFQSGRFARIVVAEIDRQLVRAVRANHGTYHVNVARTDRIESQTIDHVELLDPTDVKDKEALRSALAQATEICTCLPSVSFFTSGQANSVASLIADGLARRGDEATIVYAAENNNHAAEILRDAVGERVGAPMPKRVQFLNTVIGKMSRVATDPAEIASLNLTPIAPGIDRAFLVEEFNHILVSRTTLEGFRPGIDVFVEKDDLLPFEEAKLYGHNAIHALLGLLGAVKGCTAMTELADDNSIMKTARQAFIAESGGALSAKYASLGDELFTEQGYERYADDLLKRITNPFLADTTARAARDILRKLGAADRIFGTMSLALEYGIRPENMACGALAGVAMLLAATAECDVPGEFHGIGWRDLDRTTLDRLLHWVWKEQEPPFREELIAFTLEARERLTDLVRT